MQPKNLVVLMSDEHNPAIMGCAGHPIISTPNLDRLAARGTRFTDAYTASPICVPARAAFATGKYNFQIGYWDNGDAYDGVVPSWHHVLREHGHEVVAVGKLHFKGAGCDHGFSREIAPMHVVGGHGDIKGLIRDEVLKRAGGDKMAKLAGPGESTYTIYDREIAAQAQVWLHEAAQRRHDRPWVLFVSFVAPHFPLTAPPEHFYRYWDRELPMPKLYDNASRPSHPYLDDYAFCVDYDTHFNSPQDVKRALAGYYGLVSSVDENIGKVLAALEATGLAAETRVLYTSDHGDNLGARGLWGKSTLYQESAGVPLIIAGDGIARGRSVSEPASHVDVYPFVMECVGAPFLQDDHLGHSLFGLSEGDAPERPVLSEYHAIGSRGGATLLRVGRYKYCHYVGRQPQLFDLEADPQELHDLAGDPAHAAALADCERRLRAVLDPEEVDARAKRRQGALLAKAGGKEAALAQGDLGFTPAPGSKAEMN